MKYLSILGKRVSGWVNSLLTPHQHIMGYSVPLGKRGQIIERHILTERAPVPFSRMRSENMHQNRQKYFQSTTVSTVIGLYEIGVAANDGCSKFRPGSKNTDTAIFGQ